MTDNAQLAEVLAEAVTEVPGVAFLRPGVVDHLRSRLPGSPSPHAAGLRVDAPAGGGPWAVDVRIVLRPGARALDVARATRTAVDQCLATRTAEPRPRTEVRITVTGIA